MIKKNIIIFMAFIIVLTSIRLISLSFHSMNMQDHFQNGNIDLTNWEMKEEKLVSLSGEWDFYPNRLLEQQDIEANIFSAEKKARSFPNDWFDYVDKKNYSYGTYHLELTLNQEVLAKSFSVYIPRIPSASRVIVNGDVIEEEGNATTDIRQYKASTYPYIATFHTDTQKVDILIQVSHNGIPINFSNKTTMLLGEYDAITDQVNRASLNKVMVLIVILTFMVCSVVLFFIAKRSKALFYFSLLLASACTMILLDMDAVALLKLPFDYRVILKIVYLVYIMISVLLVKFTENFLPKYATVKVNRYFIYFYLLYGLFVIFVPIMVLLETRVILGVVLISAGITVFVQFLRALKANEQDSYLLLLSALALTNNIVWANVKHRFSLGIEFYPFDLLFTLFLFATFWLRQFMRHVDEIKEISDQLYRANKSKDDFLANTSHELRNPLHSMTNIAQYVLDNKDNHIEDKDRQDLNLLVQVGKRMSLLINDLIDLSLIKEKRIRLDRKAVNVRSTVIVVLDMLQYMLDGKDLKFVNNVKPSLPPIYVDENRLIQILLNLIHNSIKFTDKGTITVQAKEVHHKMRIEVMDTGAGIEEDYIKKIFIPYEQRLNAMEQADAGVGLGLAVTKELVDIHGGEILVDSKLGEGTTIHFTLPLATDSEDQEAIQPIVSDVTNIFLEESANDFNHPSEKSRLLLVDDERINLSVVSKILDPKSFDISFASSGEEALEKINQYKFDLVISDVMMPNMSGYELTRRIREHTSLAELPILLLTARGRPEDLETGFLSGANDYVVKPIEPLELRARVRILTELNVAVTDKMRMETAWLRAQIKPHFLFNTINSILILMEKDQEKMENLLEKFIYYLQTSFDFQNVDHVVPLEQELNLVDAYLSIEKVRFDDRININWEIPDLPKSIHVPPLSIQTLVENSVTHGILNKSEGGDVTIEVIDHKDTYEVQIRDNGIGMPSEVREGILKQNHSSKYGIGLLNTDKRLRQFYGDGLHITSKLHEGTTIAFHVPKSSGM
ncbi:hybrid sensor histidine kinase/response regulator [Gracilibacillus massiliensis]|uniref:hybrid sensor histidine kinase/response regulator n=1 Tax=Gracilibacillus massiliensis TaxID=1564956 RepID=UPI00071C69EE|nr:ATP-binding protein [Gracilibacillus massiliensis]